MLLFMNIMESSFNGVFQLWFTELRFPEPIGIMTAADIMLFFAASYLIADTVSTIGGRD